MGSALLVCVIALATQQAAAPPPAADDLPVSLDRIQRALSAPAPITLKEEHPVFRLEVIGAKPTLEEILGEKFWVGAAPYGGMTHKEFMDRVTPQQMQPYGDLTGKYLLADAALGLSEQWALKQALKKLHDAKSDHEREAARKEVMDALNELERERRAAGLPDK
jgi:hypothetical protein